MNIFAFESIYYPVACSHFTAFSTTDMLCPDYSMAILNTASPISNTLIQFFKPAKLFSLVRKKISE